MFVSVKFFLLILTGSIASKGIMLICNFVVYDIEIAINKSMFLLDHMEN